MYAADSRLRQLLPDLDIETRFADHGFDPDEQVQPCSVDLRLDVQFWEPRKPRRGRTIDLTERRLADMAPAANWKRVQLEPGETYVLKPGRVLLGRVYEKVTMPAGWAGKVEGRSSFARMGLMVHCTGDFVNPGWRGHMPLELVNFSPAPIKLVPLMSICQLMLVQLTEPSERVYGDKGLSSKYPDDDGGPSYWWRDQMVEDLLSNMGRVNLAIAIREKLYDQIGLPAPDVIRRLYEFAERLPVGEVDSAEGIADKFVANEEKLQRRTKLLRACQMGSFPLMLSVLIGSLFAAPIPLLHGSVVVLTLLSAGFAWLGYRRPTDNFFTSRELEARRLELGAGRP